jgi:hypothetical protein
MSEIDDIFARLGGGRITASDQRDQRDIPRRGKAGGSRVVEVVHVTSRRSGAAAPVPRRSESGVRAQSWDGGFPTRPAPHPAPSPQPAADKAPAPVGHVIARWEPVAAPAPIAEPAPAPTRPLARPLARPAESNTRPASRPVADPFNPDDDRANCLRCGYAVEAARERRGLMTCAACAGTAG